MPIQVPSSTKPIDGSKIALKNAEKSFGKWIGYAIVGYLPFIIGFYMLIAYHASNYEFKFPQGKLPEYVKKCIPFFFVFIFLEYLFLWMTGRQHYYRLNDAVSSIFMGSFQQVVNVIIKGLAVFPYAYIYENYRVFHWPNEDQITIYHPVWWAMFVAVEFGYYWMHRFAHEWNPMWAGHIVHHSSEEYNLTTALRQGTFQNAYSWVFYLFIAPFFPVSLFVGHSQINTIYQFWIHTRAIGKFPAIIELIFNTPSHHRVHHGQNLQYCDRNYGGTLIIFDRIFGTFEPEKEEVVYGVGHPPGTWNPLYLQTHHWFEMWEAAKKTPGVFNKMRVFLDFGPVFNYEILHPDLVANPPPPISVKTQVKYDSHMPNTAMSLYGFVHCALVVIEVYLFLLTNDKNSGWANLMFGSFLIFEMYSISAVFDRKRWAKLMETVRMGALLYLVVDLTPVLFEPQAANLLVMLTLNVVLLSFLLLAIADMKTTATETKKDS